MAAELLDPPGEILHHVRRRRDRVAGVEPTARRDGAHSDGLVPVEEDVVLVGTLQVVVELGVGVRLADVRLSLAGGLFVVVDDGLSLVAEPFLQRGVEVLDGELCGLTRRTQGDDVGHDRPAGLLRERLERHVEPDHLVGDL